VKRGVLFTHSHLGGENSVAVGVNDMGQIVGYSDTPSGQDAFLYTDGQMVDLNNLIDPSSGWSIVEADGINDDGQIVATGYQDGLGGEFDTLLLTPVPEPVSASMLVFVLLSKLASRPTRADR
jgi:probable HAF family extracellular repeat protein